MQQTPYLTSRSHSAVELLPAFSPGGWTSRCSCRGGSTPVNCEQLQQQQQLPPPAAPLAGSEPQGSTLKDEEWPHGIHRAEETHWHLNIAIVWAQTPNVMNNLFKWKRFEHHRSLQCLYSHRHKEDHVEKWDIYVEVYIHMIICENQIKFVNFFDKLIEGKITLL